MHIFRSLKGCIISLFNSHYLQIRPTRMLLYFVLWEKTTITEKGAAFCLAKCTLYLYCCLLPIRCLTVSFLKVQHCNLLDHASIDPLLSHLMLHFSIVNEYTIVADGLLGLFAIHLDYTVYFKSGLRNIAYEIIYKNGAHFWTLNTEKKQFTNCKTVKELTGNLWNGRGVRFHQQKLKYFEHVGAQIRAKAAILSTILEWAIAGFIVVNGKVAHLTLYRP